MEPKIQSSFIPKRPISQSGYSKKKNRSVGVVFIISFLIFLVTAGIAGGLFVYKGYLNSSIENKRATLEKARASFAPAKIQELQRLDTRMKTADALLKSHTAPSLLFNLLERTTLKTVQFDELNYTVLSDGVATLSMKGVAKNFASVALQSDAFGIEQSIQEPIFSDLNVNNLGDAVFQFDSLIEKGTLSYNNNIVSKLEILPEPETGTSTVEDSSSTSSESGANSQGNQSPQ